MAASVEVRLQAGAPTATTRCPGCHGRCYSFPLTALLPTGVQPVGKVQACPRCDKGERVAREHVTRRGDDA